MAGKSRVLEPGGKFRFHDLRSDGLQYSRTMGQEQRDFDFLG
jgi:hypothetical protein